MLNNRLIRGLLLVNIAIMQVASATLTLKEQAAHVYFTSKSLTAIKQDLDNNKLNQEVQEALVPLVINKYKKQLDPHFCTIVKGPGWGTANVLTFSQCGKYVLTGFHEEVYLWELPTGKVVRRLAHPGAVCSVALSSDRRYALTSSWDNRAYFWDLSTGRIIRTLRGEEEYIGLGMVAFSCCNTYALIGSNKKIRIGDLKTGETVQVLAGYTNLEASIPVSLAISQCGNYTLIGCREHDTILRPHDNYDSAAYLWDLHNPTVFISLHGHTGQVDSVAFSPDSKHALTGSSDGTARLWSVATGQVIATISHGRAITSLVVSHCGNYALMGSLDTSVGLWNLETDQLIKLPASKGTAKTVAFSQCGRYALAGYPDNTVHIWDLAYYKKTISLKELLNKINLFAYDVPCTIL